MARGTSQTAPFRTPRGPLRVPEGRLPAAQDNMIVGYSAALHEICRLLSRIAETDSTVLICGESGTGKQLLAQAIHSQSRRAEGPFVTVCCAALPDTLLESELFGHERGAFTDAVGRRLGRFELADQGTLFLDEVGEMSPAMQAKLLRVLQQREFERLGGGETIKVDVRVIAATNKDLNQEVDGGRFRADLFFRLNVVPLRLPPLRERKQDIPLFCEYFVARFNRAMGKAVRRVGARAVATLMDHPWPGNIRELENCLERAMILARGEEIGAEHLRWPGSELQGKGTAHGESWNPLEIAERGEIERTLRQTEWNRSRAADALRVSRKTLYLKIRKYGLAPGERAVG